MNYDEQVLGVGNSSHPANQEETELELTNEEKLENQIDNLKKEIFRLQNILTFRTANNFKVAQICQGASGENTFIYNQLKNIL